MASKMASLIICVRRFFGLVYTPYATMRSISLENGWSDVYWIGALSIFYFFTTTSVRFWGAGLLGAVGLFFGSIFFFSFLPSPGTYKEKRNRLFKTWAYTLFPTILWFYTTHLFYFLLPPPRTTSLWGKSFSIFYIAYSVSLLVWKLILVYLALRFSLRIQLYRIIYYMLIYVSLSIPLWVLMYICRISRIPFV